MGQPRVTGIGYRKSSSHKTKKRLAVKSAMLATKAAKKGKR